MNYKELRRQVKGRITDTEAYRKQIETLLKEYEGIWRKLDKDVRGTPFYDSVREAFCQTYSLEIDRVEKAIDNGSYLKKRKRKYKKHSKPQRQKREKPERAERPASSYRRSGTGTTPRRGRPPAIPGSAPATDTDDDTPPALKPGTQTSAGRGGPLEMKMKAYESGFAIYDIAKLARTDAGEIREQFGKTGGRLRTEAEDEVEKERLKRKIKLWVARKLRPLEIATVELGLNADYSPLVGEYAGD